MKRTGVIALGTVLAVAAAAAGVFLTVSRAAERPASAAGQAGAGEAAPTPVSVVKARLGPVAEHLSSTSAVEAERTAKILSETSGVVTEILVREGQQVAAGAVLARVDSRERRLTFEQAALRLQRAEAELTRQQRAFAEELVAEYDYEKARFDRDLAASELRSAELDLERTAIRAPFAGRVTEVLLVAGSHLQRAEHLLTLADFDTLVARLYLPERDVVALLPGQPAVVRPESRPDAAGIPGRIREISPVVDPGTGTVKVTVAIPVANGGEEAGTVRPGSFARVQIETGRRERAVLLPKRALLHDAAGAHVFVVDGGRAIRREVTTGAEVTGAEGALVELPEGVEAGTPVVVAGHADLTSGAAVEVLATRVAGAGG